MIRLAFGRALRKLREDANLSQEELASKGISRGHISEMEKGLKDPGLVMLKRLADRLHVSLRALIDETERQYEQLTTKSAESVHLVDLAVEDDILLVTVGGTAEYHACVQLHRQVQDAAQQKQLRKILLNCQDADGDVPAQEQDYIAGEIVVYAAERKIDLKLAMVGAPPTVDGYVARGIRARGGDCEVFDSVEKARAWLNES